MALIVSLVLVGLSACGVLTFSLRRRLFARWMRLPPAQYRTTVVRRIPVRMPDGVILLADHYFPKPAGSFPTILMRSPWGRGWEQFPFSVIYMILAQRFAERGFHVLVQSVRERAPEDALMPANEAEDGRATLAWIAEQSWFNGELGLWGASYLGYVQWAVAADAPPFLKAIVPITTSANWRAFFFNNHVLAFERILYTLLIAPASRLPFFLLLRRLQQQHAVLTKAALQLPPIDADTVIDGAPNPAYRAIFAHLDESDPYWTPIDQRAALPRVTAATHLVGGWYDIFLRETLADYAALVATGHAPYLTIGPWTHSDSEVGGTGLRQGLLWFNAHLKGQATALRVSPIRIFVMGADTWRDLETWPPRTTEQPYFLHSDGMLAPQPAGSDSQPDTYCYNPADPTPAIGGAMMHATVGAHDQRPLEARSDVLCYTTQPLEQAIEIIGTVKLRLYVRSSAPSTDFVGRLCDVHPDGTSMNICDGLLRVEQGTGNHQPDRSIQIEIDLGATAYRFQPKHRVRVHVASGAHPRWHRNFGTGRPVGYDTTMVRAHQTVYHDNAHRSTVILPLAIKEGAVV